MRYSVVLPAHRADSALLEAVRSVEEAIASDDAELIVIANGPDRQAVISALQRAGVAAATRIVASEIASLTYCLNKGAELASGDYVARFDSDDICLHDRFSRQYELAVKEGVDFLFSDAWVIDALGRRTGERMVSRLSLWIRCGPIHPTAFIRREALLQLGGYGNLEYSEDYHLWLRAEAEGYKLAVDHRPAIRYRVHGQQATDKSRIMHTFATNIGIKVTLGLRKRRLLFVFGSAVDAIWLVYRKCRAAFL